VIIGEQKGQGIKYGFKSLWDPETDSFAQDVYMNVCFYFKINFL
jgi:hypothetical protein